VLREFDIRAGPLVIVICLKLGNCKYAQDIMLSKRAGKEM
jgi:hypothetical protein